VVTVTPADLGKAFSEDEGRLLLLPPRLLGYASKEKVWGQFLVDSLISINHTAEQAQNGSFWNELELDDESKKLLMAFVQRHRSSASREPGQSMASTDAKAFDVIEGKGQRLVILLHSPPVVGKTLTAETIALATGRPLLTISVAETGVDHQQAEKDLTDIFADAARWEAVLLLHEAGVFVEQRVKPDLDATPSYLLCYVAWITSMVSYATLSCFHTSCITY
jgi:hypothetical protein